MGSPLSTNKMASNEAAEKALAKAQEIVSSHPVVVFSKTYCGFCKTVKKLLSDLGAAQEVIELDEESDGAAIQDALHAWTKQRSVPNVFIGGKHVGGCDDTQKLHREGKLVPMLEEAKVKDAGALATEDPAQPSKDNDDISGKAPALL
ncbi:unnamed protein product [Cuscuta campestris]|uniref:Glutaredoxin domain-containing protein n=1 Tax=Cuscuta campestris TaxID=132261 RepID=A0A484N6M5_9ASTE|nr:unnamed protein product [Cuscuta campestris]